MKLYTMNAKKPSKYFQYEAYGKTKGDINAVPVNFCGICGEFICQPLPTNIWLHENDVERDFEDTSDHVPRFAITLELLLILNQEENNMASYTNFNYGHGCISNRNHCECNIHKKYWLQQLGLDLKNNKLVGGVAKKSKEYSEYWWTHHARINLMSFIKFITSGKVEYLKSNPRLYPRVIVEFYQRDRKNSYSGTWFNKRKYDYHKVPQKGDKVILNKKPYLVITDTGKPYRKNSMYSITTVHVQPEEKAKKWLAQERRSKESVDHG